MAPDGSLYYIRKPNDRAPKPAPSLAAVRDAASIPLRIQWAIGMTVELFVFRRTGEPLLTRKKEDVKAARCPDSWLLMRQTGGNPPETLAKGAMVFDLCTDGSVVYSGGIDVYTIDSANGRGLKILTGTPFELLMI